MGVSGTDLIFNIFAHDRDAKRTLKEIGREAEQTAAKLEILNRVSAGGAKTSGVLTMLGGVPPLAAAAAGALLAIPAALAAGGAAAGVLALAMRGTGKAFEGIKGEAVELKTDLVEVGDAIQAKLAGPLNGDLTRVRGLLHALTPDLADVGGALGRAGHELAEWGTSAQTVRQLHTILGNTKVEVGYLGTAAKNTAGLFVDLAVAAGPTMEHAAEGLANITGGLREFFAAQANNGRLDELFKTLEISATGLLDALKPLGASLFNLFSSSGTQAAASQLFDTLGTGTRIVSMLVDAFASLPTGVQSAMITIGALGFVTSKTVGVFASMGQGLSGLGGKLDTATGSAGKATTAMGHLGKAVAALGIIAAAVETGMAIGEWIGEWSKGDVVLKEIARTGGSVAQQMEGARKAVVDFNDALAGVNDPALQAAEAQLRYVEASTNLRETLAANGPTMNQNTEAGRANQHAYLDAAAAALELAKAQAASATDSEVGRQALITTTAAIRTMLLNAGVAKDQVDLLTGSILAIPPSKHVPITTSAPTATGEVWQLQSTVNSLRGRTIDIYVNYLTTGTTPSTDPTFGGILKHQARGGITPIHAAGGLLGKASIFSGGRPLYAFAEPSTMQEAFIPRRGGDAGEKRRITETAAAWQGGRVDWGGGGTATAAPAAPTIVFSPTINVTAGMGTNGQQLGSQIAEVLGQYIKHNPTWMGTQMRRGGGGGGAM